jgi:hypothetical protein
MSEKSARQLVLEFLCRHPRVTVKLLHEGVLKHLTIKAAERALANLILDKLVRSLPGLGKEKIYTLTQLGARRRGLDERRFRREPNFGAKRASIALLAFCVQEQRELLTAAEFAELFPEQAKCCDMKCHRRYFIDDDDEQPLLSMIVPDHARESVKRVTRTCRRVIDDRKAYQPWRDLIYARLFQVVAVTPLESKAEEIRKVLRHDTYPHRVVAVPALVDLVSLEERK